MLFETRELNRWTERFAAAVLTVIGWGMSGAGYAWTPTASDHAVAPSEQYSLSAEVYVGSRGDAGGGSRTTCDLYERKGSYSWVTQSTGGYHEIPDPNWDDRVLSNGSNTLVYSQSSPGLYFYRVACSKSQWEPQFHETNVDVSDPIFIQVGSIARPGAFTLPSLCRNTYNVKWGASSNANRYQLQVSTDGGSNWTTLFSNNNVTSYSQNVTSGTSRKYRVRARYYLGEGNTSQ